MKRCKECAYTRELKRIRIWQRAKKKNPEYTPRRVNPHPQSHNRVEAGVYESVQLLKMNPARWGARDLAMRYDIPAGGYRDGDGAVKGEPMCDNEPTYFTTVQRTARNSISV